MQDKDKNNSLTQPTGLQECCNKWKYRLKHISKTLKKLKPKDMMNWARCKECPERGKND